MFFTQGRFLVFFLLVFAVHWALRSHRARKLWLLAASYAFYAAWDWRYLSLVWLSTLVDYLCGRAMERRERQARRPWLVLSLSVSLGMLGFFKYAGFFVDSAAALLAWLGLPAPRATLEVALPLGISFYTFQAMSYAIDVYRGRLAPVHDLADFALFVAFFPQLGAGPIARGVHFLPQLSVPREFARHVALRSALALLLVGFFKKACVADGIAAVVEPVFADPAGAARGTTWLALLLYHVQIYCDFSGYTDMAIAFAGLLGYQLPENFTFPYFARTVGDFWRRWHVSLSTWMRDYLFLPLAGRRPSPARLRLAVLATMGVCGLWHGAGWQFAGFGLLHGAYLVLEELWSGRSPQRTRASWPGGVLACVLLNVLVLLTWPVFRLESFGEARELYGTLFGLLPAGARTIGAGAAWILPGLALVHWAAYRSAGRLALERWPAWGFALAYGFAWSLVLPWVAQDLAPFIYFQF